MTNLFSQYRTVIAFVVVVAVLFLGYQYFFAPSQEAALTVNQTPQQSEDQSLVALLFQT